MLKKYLFILAFLSNLPVCAAGLSEIDLSLELQPGLSSACFTKIRPVVFVGSPINMLMLQDDVSTSLQVGKRQSLTLRNGDILAFSYFEQISSEKTRHVCESVRVTPEMAASTILIKVGGHEVVYE